ncbi:hypothetical protein PAXRUDRAFT_101086, partial [Paxillus rubicundulus Ve08.2h10]
EDDELALLEGLQDLPFLKSETHYYMGSYHFSSVGGGLGLEPEHVQALESMEQEAEPDVGVLNEVDKDPILITAFSDNEGGEE